MPLSDSFKGMDPADYRIDRVLMVGALYGKETYLDDADFLLLRVSVRTLAAAGFGFAEDVAVAARNIAHRPSAASVDIINIRDDMGARDFLAEKPRGDLVIFCNIPRDRNPEYSFISRSFELSVLHQQPGLWGRVTEAAGAKAVVAFGGPDCLGLGDFSNPSHRPVFMNPIGASHLGYVLETQVARSILEEGEAYFSSIGAPMEQACIDYQTKPPGPLILNVPIGLTPARSLTP